jgi:hypothetical protein
MKQQVKIDSNKLSLKDIKNRGNSHKNLCQLAITELD